MIQSIENTTIKEVNQLLELFFLSSVTIQRNQKIYFYSKYIQEVTKGFILVHNSYRK